MSGPLGHVAVIGAGRMGEGIALAFAQAGWQVSLIDLKAREAQAQATYFEALWCNLVAQVDSLVALELIGTQQAAQTLARIGLVPRVEGGPALGRCRLVFEAVPEVLTAKREALAWIDRHVAADTVIASTTSTFLVTELAGMVSAPQRMLNAHWLNPAHLMPLVELSRSAQTSEAVVAELLAVLRGIGKAPVVCSATPGFIVPRLQALVMNEAVRMVEEGVASAEQIDQAVRTGFGLRFSVLGLLEFIDWGGGDILYHASAYLGSQLGERYQAPQSVLDNMAAGRNGLRDGVGFYDYRELDVAAYRQGRLVELVQRLRQANLAPRFASGLEALDQPLLL
ncbi:3-hydroxybutyryl-CoA dehydrogenase [Pseudomonas putida]|uniref:L-gulonate 3-dehydrogenase n=3 Tax=Pseudomonas TaxID=286 RepID=A0A7W2QM59_PSEPU|nr:MULTISPECIES: 3-hydroxybutyryl-CoA dehydrogenase [Pseudomonas]MBA6119349.1 3-hydroxybutyryl-CoA dehydrogenase [Pseudomonas putida]MBI6945151.1 3-hydroxybutyryl-CoA dehydrogenase [Pseudomonas putida]MBI6961040.1 3-hydroxybutyryl-CoA dehydrogenase [Pseudomonas putida]MCZ9637446.1 3-hydroxybutyryl-CoA dehydrogenase [Pseudomonas putida]MEC4879043.1 3-hydroxybutyryl-CoA dehydrogenase [Pseudomonas sp. NC26]